VPCDPVVDGEVPEAPICLKCDCVPPGLTRKGARGGLVVMKQARGLLDAKRGSVGEVPETPVGFERDRVPPSLDENGGGDGLVGWVSSHEMGEGVG